MDLVGRTVGNYVVRRQVGEGGMGTVYLAEHPRINRRVAIKVLHPEMQRTPGAASRFLTEARASSEILSEHVIEILDFGELQGGEPYLTMEWLEGSTLAERLRQEGKFTFARTLHVLGGAGRALSAAHAKGVVHRDLKPDNVFLVDRNGDRDFVKVLDFGIAKIVQKEGSLANFRTQTGAILGTPAYMSPEQGNGAAGIDHRSDIYSLGVMAYELVTGQLPFIHDGWGEMLLAHMTEPPVPPIDREPTLAPQANAAILRALAKAPSQRYQSVEEFLQGLVGNASGSPDVGRAATMPMAGTLPVVALPVQTGDRSTTLRGASGERETILSTDGSRDIPRSRRPFFMLGASLVVAAAGAIAIAARRQSGPDRPSAGSAGFAPFGKVRTTADVVAPSPPSPPSTVPANGSAAIVRHRLRIRAQPALAKLILDGGTVPNPCDLSLTDDGQTHLLTVRAEGFDEQRRWLALNSDVNLDISLKPKLTAGAAVNRKAPSVSPRPPGAASPPPPQSLAGPPPLSPAAVSPLDQDEILRNRPRLKLQTKFPSE